MGHSASIAGRQTIRIAYLARRQLQEPLLVSFRAGGVSGQAPGDAAVLKGVCVVGFQFDRL